PMTHDEVEAIAALDAVGAASPEETRRMNAHLAGCDSCRRAREEYGEAALQLVYALDPVTPPNDVRDRVVRSANGRPRLAAPSPGETPGERGRDARTPLWWLATAATLFLALWGWREMGIRVAREHIVAQQAEIRGLTEVRNRLAAQNEKLAS